MALKLSKMSGKPEIFHTIQGEGVSVGVPAVFVRTALCNLQCYWCDTDYTWNWEGTDFQHQNDAVFFGRKYSKEEQIVTLSTAEVVAAVDRYRCQHLVITGGEPMMQQAQWVDVMQELRSKHPEFYFEVETNGTLLPTAEFDALINQYNVSPKLANSRMRAEIREKNDVLRYFAVNIKSWFKFVVENALDSAEVGRLIHEYGLPKNKVMLMPLASDVETLQIRGEWLSEQCKMMNVRYSDRLHVRLFDGARGT